MKNNNNLLRIVSQAFYGNRTGTEVELENLDRFILGYIDNSIPMMGKINRTIINIPNTDNLVIIYNKYEEEKSAEKKEKLLKKEDYKLKPLVMIPEENLKIYSRCIVCRMNKNGDLESLEKEDFKKFMKYLAE